MIVMFLTCTMSTRINSKRYPPSTKKAYRYGYFLELVLENHRNPVAYVDGYATDAVEKQKVEGNTVTVTVKDFARISGYKEIQLYIPAKQIVTISHENQTVPNKCATIAFKDVQWQERHKESNLCNRSSTGPRKPEEPKPNENQLSTVGPADGSNPSTGHRLKELGRSFRFDVTAKVPTDSALMNSNLYDAQGRDVPGIE